MPLQIPHALPLPDPPRASTLIEVPIARLQPTQLCIGLAEVNHRIADFAAASSTQRRNYLRRKPVPLVRNRAGALWMVDRHHRLSALQRVDAQATAFGYLVLNVATTSRQQTLQELQRRGWLYLHDKRGKGPWPPDVLPQALDRLQDDLYRSLVWKLKREGLIAASPLVPFHEFRWAAWLRRHVLPAFHSLYLDPALHAARRLVCSPAAAALANAMEQQVSTGSRNS